MLITDGELRAFLDGEVTEERRQVIERALQDEPALARRLETMRRSSAWAADTLEALEETAPTADAQAAFASLQLGGRSSARRLPTWAAIAASLLLCAGLMTWQPARAMAQRLLGFLRFESVAVIEIDRGMMRNRPSEQQAQLFAQALSDSVEQIKEPGPSRSAATREQAAEWAKLDLRLPAGRVEQPVLTVTDSSAMQMEVDLVRVERMIDVIGGSDIEIPQRLDGATVRVDIFEVASAFYGGCWGERRKKEVGCFQLVQTRSPSVVTTPALDLGEIARLGLEVAGMSGDDAAAVTGSIDWASTLVIPVPKNHVRQQEIEVDGVDGVLMVEDIARDGPQEYAILWVKNGVAYGLNGYGDWGLGLQAANDLE